MRSAWRIVLLPVLLACAIVFGTSRIGHTGLLSLHLATAHHDVSESMAVDQLPDARPGPPPEHAGDVDRHDHHPEDHSHSPKHHEHGPGDGQHPHEAHERAEPSADQRIANAPHAHGGLVHTHAPRPDEELVIPSTPIWEYYLPASAAPLPHATDDRSRAPWIVLSPDQAIPSIESPPPRLPG